MTDLFALIGLLAIILWAALLWVVPYLAEWLADDVGRRWRNTNER